MRYNNANQSEPLRVVLFFLLALALLGSNQLADAVGAPPPEPYPTEPPVDIDRPEAEAELRHKNVLLP